MKANLPASQNEWIAVLTPSVLLILTFAALDGLWGAIAGGIVGLTVLLISRPIAFTLAHFLGIVFIPQPTIEAVVLLEIGAFSLLIIDLLDRCNSLWRPAVLLGSASFAILVIITTVVTPPVRSLLTPTAVLVGLVVLALYLLRNYLSVSLMITNEDRGTQDEQL